MREVNHLHTFDFSAMNSRVDVTFALPRQQTLITEATERIQQWFSRSEQRFSRFLPTSELAYVNERSGKKTMISASMAEVLSLAETYHEATSGIFSPFVFDALHGCGYDRTFDQVKGCHIAVDHPPHLHPDAMELDVMMKSVCLTPGSHIDLGGIVKGWSVSRLCSWLQSEYAIERGFINAGGDLQAWGGSSPQEPWQIGIADPYQEEEEIAVISLFAGGVATSNVWGRRWHTSQGEMHHLIDTRSMRPSRSEVIQCTTTGPDTAECEVWAKVVCILGISDAVPLLQRRAPHIDALAVTRSGSVHFIGDKKRYDERWNGAFVDFFHY